MLALEVWKSVTADRTDFLDRLLAVLEDNSIDYCVIGGQGVNAYVDPLVSLDLDLVVSVEQVDFAETLFSAEFTVRRFPHSLNISAEGSQLRVQIRTDPRYSTFPERATRREVLGIELPVASLDDILQGKIWAASSDTRRPGKRRKDLLDIERLLEAYPEKRELVPADILQKLTL